jgi:methyltransferase (TIGR00027 family)
MTGIESNPGLESTARWTAAARGLESRRDDRLLTDPWAVELAGEAGAAWLKGRPEDSVLPMVLRTRYFDDFLQRITSEEDIRQIVLMAAGLDTRAFRLAWPPRTVVYELDRPAVLRHKEGVLHAAGAAPACARRTAEVDLTGPWEEVLAGAGFEAQKAAGWLLEGFLFYLDNASLRQILDQVASLGAPGSWMGFDVVNSAMFDSEWTRPWIEMQAAAGAPWLGTLDDPVEFLAERGWTATLSQAGAPDANHGRWTLPVIPTTMPGMPHNWYVTAHREKTATE